jgi:SOS-response transcriptional repressor LexA
MYNNHFSTSTTGHTLLSKDETIPVVMPDNAMQNAGIYPGDQLDVLAVQQFRNGDIVAVEISGKLFIRAIYVRNNFVMLEPAHPAFRRFSIEWGTPGIRFLGRVQRIWHKARQSA